MYDDEQRSTAPEERGMWKEFREFVNKGNAIDLAVGVVVGAAFGKIVNSLVADLIMPIVSLATGRIRLEDLFVQLSPGEFATLEAAREAGVPVVAYGAFINVVVEFMIVAFSIFLVVRQVNRWRGAPKEPAAS
jgi:large conductance mechanosensitive channel